MKSTKDRMIFTILEDGAVKIEVDGISGANHTTADQLFKMVTRLLGGGYSDRRRKEAHDHVHRSNLLRH